MKRGLCMLLFLILLCGTALADGLPGDTQVIFSEKLQYATLVPAACAVRWLNEATVQVGISEEDAIPCLLIDKEMGYRRSAANYLNNVLLPAMQLKYGEAYQGGVVYEDYEIGGKRLPAALFSFLENGAVVCYLQVMEYSGEDTVFYTVKYAWDESGAILQALDMAVRFYRGDPNAYGTYTAVEEEPPQQEAPQQEPAPSAEQEIAPDGGQEIGDPGEQELPPSEEQEAASFTLPMTLAAAAVQGMRLGRCLAPAGYTVLSGADICTDSQSAGYPLRLHIVAVSPDNRVMMSYETASAYIEIVSATVEGVLVREQRDGETDPASMTVMARCMQPREYGLAYAQNALPGVEIAYVDERDMTPWQAALDALAEQDGDPAGETAFTAGECRYAYESEGVAYYAVVASMIGARRTVSSSQIPAFGECVETSVYWSPLYTCMLICPASVYDAVCPAFRAFAGSAAASDQFNAANARLADEARGFAADGRLSSIAEYGRSVLLMMTAAGETYEDERDIDRVFGQNVYTLSDGSSVRIPAEFTLEREEDGAVYLSGIVPGLPDGEPGSQQE